MHAHTVMTNETIWGVLMWFTDFVSIHSLSLVERIVLARAISGSAEHRSGSSETSVRR